MRREFTGKTKEAAFKRADGKCEGCGAPLVAQRFTYDHRDPDYFSKNNSLENCQVLGWCCDKPKTAKDQADIGRSRRIRRREMGIKKRSTFACSRQSKWKKKIDGKVVLR